MNTKFVFIKYFCNSIKLHHYYKPKRCLIISACSNRETKMCFSQTRRSLWGNILRLEDGSVTENRWWTCAGSQPQTLTFLNGSTSPSSKHFLLSYPSFYFTSQRICVSFCGKKKKNHRHQKELLRSCFSVTLIICQDKYFQTVSSAWIKRNEGDRVTKNKEGDISEEHENNRKRRLGSEWSGGGDGLQEADGGTREELRTTQNLFMAQRSSQGKPKTHR